MVSKVNPDAISLTASGDSLVFPVREQLGIVRDELSAIEAGAARAAFWFANLAGGDIPADDTWHALPTGAGGMTGDATLATAGPNGLTLLVDAVVQIKAWVAFEAEGDGATGVGFLLDETAYGMGVATRGQLQLLLGATMVAISYDGWLAAGAVLGVGGIASGTAPTVQSISYATALIRPVA